MKLTLSPVEQFYNIIFHDVIRGTEFVLMLLNMGLLFFLLSPLPFRFKTALLNRAASTAKIRMYWPSFYWSMIGILSLLLVDAMRQTWIYTQRVAIVQEAQLIGEQDNSVRYDMETHLLVAQRNFYLTGVTLFLFICNQRFCSMLMKMQGYERDIVQLRKAQERTSNEKERAWLEAKEREKAAKAASKRADSLEAETNAHGSLWEAHERDAVVRQEEARIASDAASVQQAEELERGEGRVEPDVTVMANKDEAAMPSAAWSDDLRRRQAAAAAATISAGGVAHLD
jgi:hypothetical protein